MSRLPVAPALALSLLSVLATPVSANDSMGVIGAGGIRLATTEDVSMDREDLFISPSKVTVDYVFTNKTEKDVESVVAFPMPEIRYFGEEVSDVPNAESDNFMNFKVSQDGAPIDVELEQRAFASGLDVTDALKKKGVHLLPVGEAATADLKTLSPEEAEDWVARGIVTRQSYTDGDQEKVEYAPGWTLKSTYWWRTVFPAGQSVKVHHSYKPSVGGTVDVTFFRDGAPAENYDLYAKRYCINEGFTKAVAKAQAQTAKNTAWMEKWLSYVLVTANNWSGPIGTFHLTVDKEDPNALVRFCGDGSEKTGPTTYELTMKDYYPQEDLNVLIVYPQKLE